MQILFRSRKFKWGVQKAAHLPQLPLFKVNKETGFGPRYYLGPNDWPNASTYGKEAERAKQSPGLH